MKQEHLEKIVQPLIEWFKQNGRILPWRESKNPYKIWLSEIMLQQTKIEAVKKYYTRFLEEIPTIQDLATVEEEKLLKLWEGLGYYNRARNLKKAAIILQEKYQGKMPATYQELMELPGIGEYTAGAIASIAYQEKVPAVDGNVLRVMARVTEDRQNVLLPEVKKQVTKRLISIMPKEAGIFNEAIMELGELVCLPNGGPLCNKCPLQGYCLAYKKSLTEEIPVRQKKQVRKKEKKTVFIFCNKGKIAIQKREKRGLLAGMYEFPNTEGYVTKEELETLLARWNLTASKITPIGKYQHTFSHKEWEMKGYVIDAEQQNTQFQWVTKQELLEKYPIPTAFSGFKEKI